MRNGCSWRVGTASDVAWINTGTSVGLTITAGIPAVFEDYATVILPGKGSDQAQRDRALIAVLKSQSTDQRWWLGYLDRGGCDVVFPGAPTVSVYVGWPYVLVQAGPGQAVNWRRAGTTQASPYVLPDLMFPADRSWLVSTLWDDDWSCVGGSVALVDALLNHPDLRSHARRVRLGDDATPPGHRVI